MSEAPAPAPAPDRTPAPPAPRPQQQPWVVLVRILGLVTAGLVLVVTTVGLVSYYFQRTIEETRVIADEVEIISGQISRGSITVHAAQDADVVTVHSTRRFSFGTPQLTTRVTGGRLVLGSACADHPGKAFGTCSIDLDVSVPKGVALDLTTSQGNVRIDGPDAQTRLTTASGSVHVLRATSNRIDISTAAGGVTLEFAAPPDDAVVRTAAGSITIRVPADGTAYNVTGSTSLGSRRVDVPVDLASTHRLDVSSSVGGVTVTTQR